MRLGKHLDEGVDAEIGNLIAAANTIKRFIAAKSPGSKEDAKKQVVIAKKALAKIERSL